MRFNNSKHNKSISIETTIERNNNNIPIQNI